MAGGYFAGLEALNGVRDGLTALRRIVDTRSVGATSGKEGPLREALAELEELVAAARKAFYSDPSERFLGGSRLTEAEFLMCRSLGLASAWVGERGAANDFEVFEHLFYEDDDVCGYINPVKTDANGRTSMLGIDPAVVRVEALRPAQREFLERFAPAMFGQFRRETSSKTPKPYQAYLDAMTGEVPCSACGRSVQRQELRACDNCGQKVCPGCYKQETHGPLMEAGLCVNCREPARPKSAKARAKPAKAKGAASTPSIGGGRRRS